MEEAPGNLEFLKQLNKRPEWAEKRRDLERVSDLRSAYDAYWTAENHRERQAAYHEILLFGGEDCYGSGGLREWTIRKLRQLAAWLDVSIGDKS